ncbi:MAG TPA: FecR domain-containing protein [Sphingomicrobium sp.]|nr:FecR domain-containing protein [Sphingomicrobium sp.]
MSTTDPAGREKLRTEAARWFARMRGPDADASKGEFEAWLSKGPLHREAYNRAAEIFAMGKLLAEPGAGRGPARRARAWSRPGLAAAAIAATLLAAIACWPVLRKALPDREGATRSEQQQADAEGSARQWSSAGEPRAIRLPDGSLVRLQSASAITSRLTAAERILTVERGTARFFVTHESRPFVVYAGGGSVTARGTIFDVGLDSGQLVTVRLISGVVDVSPPAPNRAGHPARRRLHAGQSLSFAAERAAALNQNAAGQSALPPGSVADLQQDYQSMALSDLVRLANEHSSRPITLADARTGKLRVSGKFRIDDTGVLAERIALLFGLADDRRDPNLIILRPN